MSDQPWRPLGVETDDEVAEYDALHDGLPDWMSAAYWHWVQSSLTMSVSGTSSRYRVNMLNCALAEQMCQTLRIPLPNLRPTFNADDVGRKQIQQATAVLVGHPAPLQIADYLLAHDGAARREDLEALLARARSAWTVGERAGRPGLVRRVPLGVQVGADSVMSRAGRAGLELARAWEALYGLAPNPTTAYRHACKAVEDAAIPVVSPTNKSASLGTVIKQMEDQGDWRAPMDREHSKAPSREVLVSMMRMLWHGQHDRHGGQPSAPGDVSADEATVAVSLAVTLVNLFSSGLVARGPEPSQEA